VVTILSATSHGTIKPLLDTVTLFSNFRLLLMRFQQPLKAIYIFSPLQDEFFSVRCRFKLLWSWQCYFIFRFTQPTAEGGGLDLWFM